MRSSIHSTCHQHKDGARSYTPDALIVSGTTYYVSNNGNDEADGISLATAWQTLARERGLAFGGRRHALLPRETESVKSRALFNQSSAVCI